MATRIEWPNGLFQFKSVPFNSEPFNFYLHLWAFLVSHAVMHKDTSVLPEGVLKGALLYVCICRSGILPRSAHPQWVSRLEGAPTEIKTPLA